MVAASSSSITINISLTCMILRSVVHAVIMWAFKVGLLLANIGINIGKNTFFLMVEVTVKCIKTSLMSQQIGPLLYTHSYTVDGWQEADLSVKPTICWCTGRLISHNFHAGQGTDT